MRNLKGSLILLLAAFIWGTAFVAQTSASNCVGTFTFNATRSFVGAMFLLLLVRVRSIQKSEKKWPVKGGIICGVVLSMAMGFQQAGIGAYPQGVAASGRAGFLTAMYVVIVALCAVFFGKKLHPLVWIATVTSICGMYLLCMSGGFDAIYLGDVLELACAVCFAGHILVVDRFSDCDSVKLSCLQFFVCGILSFVVMLFTERGQHVDFKEILLPVFYAGVMSSGVAYTLQMVGQKYTQPAVASIVMSLESVFAVLAGWIILNERLSLRELTGCGFVFVAVILAQIPQFLKKSSDEDQ